MNIKKIYLITALVSTLLFLCLVVSVSGLSKSLRASQGDKQITDIESIPAYESSENTDTVTQTDEKWIIKEHNGIIGIFDENRELIRTIDTNIKSLPSKDQAMLREGFEVHSKTELNSVIEAYSD